MRASLGARRGVGSACWATRWKGPLLALLRDVSLLTLLWTELSVWLLEAAAVDGIDVFGFIVGLDGIRLNRVGPNGVGWVVNCIDSWVGRFVEGLAVLVEILIGKFNRGCPVRVFYFVVDRASNLRG